MIENVGTSGIQNGFDFAYWAIQTVAMLLTCLLIPRLKVKGPISALLTVAVLAFVNSHWWSASLFYSIPTSLSGQALLLLLANGLIFWLVVKVLPGIEVNGILPAIAAPVVFTVLSIFIGDYGSRINWRDALDLQKLQKEIAAFAEQTKSLEQKNLKSQQPPPKSTSLPDNE